MKNNRVTRAFEFKVNCIPLLPVFISLMWKEHKSE